MWGNIHFKRQFQGIHPSIQWKTSISENLRLVEASSGVESGGKLNKIRLSYSETPGERLCSQVTTKSLSSCGDPGPFLTQDLPHPCESISVRALTSSFWLSSTSDILVLFLQRAHDMVCLKSLCCPSHSNNDPQCQPLSATHSFAHVIEAYT